MMVVKSTTTRRAPVNWIQGGGSGRSATDAPPPPPPGFPGPPGSDVGLGTRKISISAVRKPWAVMSTPNSTNRAKSRDAES